MFFWRLDMFRPGLRPARAWRTDHLLLHQYLRTAGGAHCARLQSWEQIEIDQADAADEADT